MSLTHTAPEVAPSEVSGGGGSRSELVITWDVSVWATSSPSWYYFSFKYLNFLHCTDIDGDDGSAGAGADAGGAGRHGHHGRHGRHGGGDGAFASASNV